MLFPFDLRYLCALARLLILSVPFLADCFVPVGVTHLRSVSMNKRYLDNWSRISA